MLAATDKQFARGLELTEQVGAAGVEVRQDAQVWAALSPNEVGAIVEGRATVFNCRQLIIAPGAYERPTPFPGWTLPGVMTTGAAQTLARAYRVSPGQRVVIAGNGPLNLQLAAELVAGGACVVAVLESAPRPGFRHWRELLQAARTAPDLLADGAKYLAVLRRHRVPVRWSHAAVAADGEGSLRTVRCARLDEDGRAAPGSEHVLEADTLCVGYGFVPATELARMLGCRQQFVARHLGYLATATDDDGRTSVPGVFVVGDGADLGGARVALARGTLAGTVAARSLELQAPTASQALKDLRRAQAFQRALWSLYQAPPLDLAEVPDDTVLCRCEDISFGTVRAQIAARVSCPAAIWARTVPKLMSSQRHRTVSSGTSARSSGGAW